MLRRPRNGAAEKGDADTHGLGVRGAPRSRTPTKRWDPRRRSVRALGSRLSWAALIEGRLVSFDRFIVVIGQQPDRGQRLRHLAV